MKWREKKCPADGHFGVAQSPEPPLSETIYFYPKLSHWQVRMAKKEIGIPVKKLQILIPFWLMKQELFEQLNRIAGDPSGSFVAFRSRNKLGE